MHALCIALLVLVMFSCQQHDVYSRYEEMKDDRWSQDAVLAFDIDSGMIETGVPYDITIDIYNNVDYKYANISLAIDHNLDTDTAYTHLQRECQLVDNTGKWQGRGIASIYSLVVPLFENYTFAIKRNYRFEVQHTMCDNPLEGIAKIGLRVSKRSK